MAAAQESKDRGGVTVDLNSTVLGAIGPAQNIVAEEWADAYAGERGAAPSVRKLWEDGLGTAIGDQQ